MIRSASRDFENISVYACETRPYLQGARLTAWELMQDKIPVTLMADNMVGYAMDQGLIDMVVVGTDRVAANGDVANKIGTYTVATMAKRHAIPFYVACPVSTIDFSTASGDLIPIEQRAPEELTGTDKQWAHLRNVLKLSFDGRQVSWSQVSSPSMVLYRHHQTESAYPVGVILRVALNSAGYLRRRVR